MATYQNERKQSSSKTPFKRSIQRRNFELYTLVSCQKDLDEIEQGTTMRLREKINDLLKFSSIHECCEYLATTSPDEDRIFLIVSMIDANEVLFHVHELKQITAVFLFSEKVNKIETEHLINKFKKVSHRKPTLGALEYRKDRFNVAENDVITCRS